MKLFLTLVTILVCFSSFGQLPNIESNISDKQIETSEVRNEFHRAYPTILSFSQHSFWIKRQEFYVLAFNGEKWSFIKWSFEIDKNEQKKKKKKRKLDLNNIDLNSFLSFLTEVNFYNFDQDSLDLNRKDNGDGRMLVQDILDGTTDRFEIHTTNASRISTCHEAVQRQEFVATNQREKFIECKKKFLDLINKKSR